MYDSYILFSHHDNVQIGRRQQRRQLLHRLIRKAEHVSHSAAPNTLLYIPEFASAPNEAKTNFIPICKPLCCLKQSVQWMAGAVVPRVHYDKLAGKLVDPAKVFSAQRIKTDVVVMRPGRHEQNFLAVDALGLDAIFHEAIESNNVIGSPQAVQQHPGEQTRNHGLLSQPSGSD